MDGRDGKGRKLEKKVMERMEWKERGKDMWNS